MIEKQLIKRFMDYTSIPSQSNGQETKLPSSNGQYELAQHLKKECEAMCLDDILLTKDAILTAKIPGNQALPKIGFVAHLDTVDIGLSDEIHPQIKTKLPNQDVLLNEEKDIWLRESQIPEIIKYNNQDILVTDGTSVLGADNKAAISVIMQVANTLMNKPEIKHGDVYIAIVPDEEIGLRGAKAIDLDRLPVTCAYTIDCNELGELVYETFNAASALLTIKGVTAHPMSAKDILVNPLLIMNEFINQLDPLETPEHTKDKEGYIWANGASANQSTATLSLSIRDHDLNKFNNKKEKLISITSKLKEKYPKAQINLEISDTYSNILQSLTDIDDASIVNIKQAMLNNHITPKTISMRGGTDGSALSPRGIPTPNYFTGAHQFHSIYEFLPIPSFVKCYEVTLELIKLWGQTLK